MHLKEQNVPGGAFYPVAVNNDFVYISRKSEYFDIAAVSKAAMGKFSSEIINTKLTVKQSDTSSSVLVTENESHVELQYNPKKYIPFKYFLNGLLVPMPYFPYFYGTDIRYTNALMLGFTYVTSDPAENLNLFFGFGFDPFSLFGWFTEDRNNFFGVPEENITFNIGINGGTDDLSCTLYSSISFLAPELSDVYASLYLTGNYPIVNFCLWRITCN